MIMAKNTLKSLLRSESGASAILFSLAAPPLLGATAIAIDFGMLYLEERDLQGVADAAAMAAVLPTDIPSYGEEKVQGILDQSPELDIRIVSVKPGKFNADTGVSMSDRFVENDDEANAVEVQLERRVPLMLGKLMGKEFSSVTARARAARTDLVAFDLGSDLLGFDKNLPGRYLEALADTNLGLNRIEVNAILGAQVDVGLFAEILRDRIGDEDDTLGDVFSGEASLYEIVSAMAAAASTSDGQEALERIANQLSDDEIALSSLVNLGPLGRQMADRGSDRLNVGAYMMLRAALQNAQGDEYSAEIRTEIQSFGSVDVKIAGGQHTTSSPFLAVDPLKKITLYTTETRIAVEAKTTAQSIGAVKVPLYLELAPAEAQIYDVECDPSESDNGVTLRVKPSIGSAKIGEVDDGDFYDFSTNPTVAKGTLIDTPVLDILGYADLSVGGDQNQYPRLSLAEIRAGTRKRVATNDTVQALINSLISDLDVEIRTLDIGLGRQSTAIEDRLLRGLANIAPSVDAVLNEVTDMVGVKLGVADVGVTSLSCGRPTIIG
ncbi:putative transmembrane protein [Altererythrobacter epoxidivorans]|uniref:Putative transmembrane protein n=2 Tax=Altererythrobacter epoxidivorans TaxID=361183 RepID=A0A0M3TAA5_9SPHN|nr:putative transmembrane protein [Altererythrobacter epoxidivorans]